MTLDEVLALEFEQKSIRKIDMFLSTQPQTSYEYIKALSFKCLILHSLEKDKDALKYLLVQTQFIPNLDNKSIVVLCDALIDIFIDIKNVEQAIKYIEIKKDHLPTIDSEKYIYDMIRYNRMCGNDKELKRCIVEYLGEDIPDDKRIEVLEILLNIEYDEHDYDAFDMTYKKLEGYYLNNFLFDKLSDIKLKRSANMYNQHEYERLEQYINTFISDDTSVIDLKIMGAKYLLEIYLLKGENRRAMILESEYHEKYVLASLEVQLSFVESALKVSEAINNRFNIDEFEAKQEELEQLIYEQKRALKKAHKKVLKLEIEEEEGEKIINEKLVIKHEPRKEKFIETPSMDEEPSIIEISENYKSIENVLATFTTRENVKFREIFRNYGIEIEKRFLPCEIVIAMKNSPDGYHYKKERVYEKTFTDAYLDGTALNELLQNSRKLFLIDLANSIFDKNPITNLTYDFNEFKALIGFEILRNDEKIAAITYVFKDNKFEDKLIYETLKVLTSMLAIQLNKSLDYIDADRFTRAKNYLYENQSNGIKIEIDNQIDLNDKAIEITGAKHKKILSKDYLSLIDSKDAKIYRDTYREIYNRRCDEASIYYHINDKYIFEEIHVERSPITKIYSVISDKSDEEKLNKSLMDKINYEPSTHLKTKELLFTDISKIISSKKFALAMISVKNYKIFRDIYGYEFSSDLTKLIGRCINKFETEDISSYHLEDDQYVILFKSINDLRSVKSKVSKYLHELKESLEGFNYRLKLELKAGIFRYTKAMRILDIKKILSFASEGLIDAYESDDDICVYDQNSYAERFKESQILLHVSEAIDDRSIQVNYKQVVNFNNNEIPYYIARLNMAKFDIDEKYFDSVISKREITETMDKYLIKECFHEIKTFHDDTKMYYKLIIPIHRQTLVDRMFILYLDRYLKFFKIPSEILMFDIIDDTESSITQVKKQLLDRNIKLASRGFDFVIRNDFNTYICDVKKYNITVIDAIKKATSELRIEFIISGVTNKEEMKSIAELGIDKICDEIDLFSIGDILKIFHSNE